MWWERIAGDWRQAVTGDARTIRDADDDDSNHFMVDFLPMGEGDVNDKKWLYSIVPFAITHAL
jgi:hypothetical protein